MYVMRIKEKVNNRDKWEPYDWSENVVAGDVISGVMHAVKEHARRGDTFSVFVENGGTYGEIRMRDADDDSLRTRLEFRNKSVGCPGRVWVK